MDADLDRALGYPYPRPSGSFVFDIPTETTTPLDPSRTSVDGRHAVLAIGSNASPFQLARKFRHRRGDPSIPVVAVELADHDVVYAAGLAHYGSVPATVIACEGARVAIHVTLLDDAQLEVMDASEAVGRAYDVITVEPELVASPLPLPGPFRGYVAIAGPALRDGRPVALEAIPATGRTLPARDEATVLTALAAREGLAVEAFIRRVVADAAYRRAISDRLRSEGMPAGTV